ncbi:molecular chaperone DnaJ [Desulfosarcina widdelii]|uniref:Molecular chaperone DnaJ n=1 Tax=Desulfosarcina widdelii TaxID=947919 RepID=A0A5K7Z4U5_9BACT|nr:J domain-containing protein [Desulfosarcina widdelii]BBO74943.1 molecular chaperone DnaJ [Desulfosarcina widdelii]
MLDKTFCDHYENLQISSNADSETIERVYRLLAKKYHTDNDETGDIEKFETVTNAYKILSNPVTRAAYDAKYEPSKNKQWKAIAQAFKSEGFGSDQHIRRTILSILYTKRREDPSNSGVGIVQLENLMEWPGETLDFHIWYLKERKLIVRTETGGFEITAEGVDTIEREGLVLNNDRLLPESSGLSERREKLRLLES